MRRTVIVALSLVLGAGLLFWGSRRSTPSTPSNTQAMASNMASAEEAVDETTPEAPVPDAPQVEEERATASASTAATVQRMPDDEASLMVQIRRADDPELCIRLAREGNRRFPNSPDAPERTSLLIHALAKLGRSSEARGEAEAMVNGSPDSQWVREIEQFTGAKRHRNLRVNDAGDLEYYE